MALSRSRRRASFLYLILDKSLNTISPSKAQDLRRIRMLTRPNPPSHRKHAHANHSSDAESLAQKNIALIARLEQEAHNVRKPGERIADAVAHAVGSWKFILIQSGLFAIYMALNVVAYVRHWDPYPFILLNLFLSFQAAYTGPILMMSQNRQARVTERRNHLDLQINLLAERESTQILRLLRSLCEKNGIALDDPECVDLQKTTEPEQMIRQIEKMEGR